jgi:phosphoglucosamine mutase
MSNFGLFQSLARMDIDCVKTAVGDKYVYEHMSKNGNRLGGEQSGHIIFGKYATTGDGILTSLKLMEVMLAKKKKMSELIADFSFYPQVLRNLRVKDKQQASTDPQIVGAVQAACESLGNSGRVLLRVSGTEPVLRLMAEAQTEEICNQYLDGIVQLFADKGYLIQ